MKKKNNTVNPQNYSISNNLTGCSAVGTNATTVSASATSLTLDYQLIEGYTWTGATVSVTGAADGATFNLEDGVVTITSADGFTGPVTVTVTAKPVTSTVTFGGAQNYTVDSDEEYTATIDYADFASGRVFNLAPKTGYEITAVKINGAAAPTSGDGNLWNAGSGELTIKNPGTAVTVTVETEAITSTVTLDVENADTENSILSDDEVEYNGTATLTIVPAAGFRVPTQAEYEDGTGNAYSYTVDEDGNATLVFQNVTADIDETINLIPTVTVTFTGNGVTAAIKAGEGEEDTALNSDGAVVDKSEDALIINLTPTDEGHTCTSVTVTIGTTDYILVGGETSSAEELAAAGITWDGTNKTITFTETADIATIAINAIGGTGF